MPRGCGLSQREVTAQLAQTVDLVNRATTELTEDSEVILARGGKTTLGVRLDGTDGRIAKLETEKANRKQKDWIAPTSLNGWTDTSSNPVLYMVDDFEFVHLSGRLAGGVIGAPMFILPVGLRPYYAAAFAVVSGGGIHGMLSVGHTDGIVKVTIGNNQYVTLDGVTFKGER